MAEHYRGLALKAAEQALRNFPTDDVLARAVARWRY